MDQHGGWRDGVTHVHIDVEGELRAGEGRGHRDPDAAVLVLVSDRVSVCRPGVEHQPVLQWDPRHRDDQGFDGGGVVGEAEPLEVDVAGRAAGSERREQHPTLEDEPVPVRAGRQPCQEAFQDVQLLQLRVGATIAAGLVLQVEVHAALDCASVRVAHSNTSSARRSAGNARGNEPATWSKVAGCPPRRSHRRNA